jgi:hypothetical protein
MDDFCRRVGKPAVPVIDNAPTHRPELFISQA